MGREFASAAARWCHLLEMDVRPEIVAVCDPNAACCSTGTRAISRRSSRRPTTTAPCWRIPQSTRSTARCRIILHQEIYCAVIRAGKHLMGEKPFGIDQAGQRRHPGLHGRSTPTSFVRCSSEFPFFPAVQRIGAMIEAAARSGRSSRSTPASCTPAISTRTSRSTGNASIAFNGEYGCMGDLGMHVCHVPFRAGWIPRTVRAVLSNIVPERPDGHGGIAPCETWDNATLLCDAARSGHRRRLSHDAQNAADRPGRKKHVVSAKSWARRRSARFSTKNPKRLELLDYDRRRQVWGQIDMGHETAFKTHHRRRSSSSASPTPSCRCGRPSSTNWSTAGRRRGSPAASRRRKPP